jgi:hypothetical protein
MSGHCMVHDQTAEILIRKKIHSPHRSQAIVSYEQQTDSQQQDKQMVIDSAGFSV